jgi:FtsP/CotA-like multicopper oxidase with cupredoxin domain
MEMQNAHAMDMGNPPEYAERARMIGPNAPGQPGPRTSAEFKEPDLGDMRAPISRNVKLFLGPQVVSIAEMPSERLSSAGEGFPPGRRVLSYADLRAVYRGTDPRPPGREIEIHLTGNMERFIWGFDGAKFSNAEPIRLKLGERVRIILVNDTMMEHPVHLHGLWSELENGHGEFRPYKHTINVKPSERLSYLLSADTPCQWAFHCHLLLPHGERHVPGGDRLMRMARVFFAAALAISGTSPPSDPEESFHFNQYGGSLLQRHL